MSGTQIIIAVVVLVVLALAAAVAYHAKTAASASTACPDGGKVGAPPYSDGYCATPVADGAAACKADAKCVGYSQSGPTTGAKLNGQIFHRKI